ncbi:PQQ-binding-like beta-propeller repeat protein [Actinoplanes sp. NPDC051494]|uniref:outer membrane protein assembly factor BamB family protein n=1 Tax=Actinoplanes sp. NPDC051494 TaxID=3363907 RepID=UPI00378EDA07
MPDRRLTAGALLTVAALAAGCTSDPAPTPTTPTPAPASSAAAPTRQSFDPPMRFGPTGQPVGEGRDQDVLLYNQTAFVAGETGTTVTDLLTGKAPATLSPTHPPVQHPGGLGKPVGHIPMLVQRAGKPAVVIPYAVQIPASGTTAAQQAVQLLIADAGTGEKLAELNVSATPAEGEGDFTAVAGEYVTIVGAQANTLVLTVGKQVTVGVDLTTGSVLWRNTALQAATVLDDTVIGLTAPDTALQQKVIGVGVADGTRRWSAATVRNAELAAAGPEYAVLLAEQDGVERLYARVTGDGKLTDRATGAYSSGLDCRYDQAVVTVCTLGASLVFALDATSGNQLWQLPATGRTAPRVTAVWHGAVYGTAGGKPVVLDAKTGVDREPSPGLAPVAVSSYAGVAAAAQENSLTAYPAVG